MTLRNRLIHLAMVMISLCAINVVYANGKLKPFITEQGSSLKNVYTFLEDLSHNTHHQVFNCDIEVQIHDVYPGCGEECGQMISLYMFDRIFENEAFVNLFFPPDVISQSANANSEQRIYQHFSVSEISYIKGLQLVKDYRGDVQKLMFFEHTIPYSEPVENMVVCQAWFGGDLND